MVNLVARSVPVHGNVNGVARWKQGRRVAHFVATELPVTCRKCLAMERDDWVPNPAGRPRRDAS